MTAPPVTRLDNAVDSKEKCSQYDVYFEDVKQTNCVIADVEMGYIERYVTYFGAIVRRNGRPASDSKASSQTRNEGGA